MTDPDPYQPIIDLTDYTLSDNYNNSVIELDGDSWVIQPTSPRPRGTGSNGRRTRTISTDPHWPRRIRTTRTSMRTARIENHEPIEIPDSPQVDTRLSIRNRKVAPLNQNRRRQSINETNEVRERSPLGGNFGVCPICLETLGTQPLVSTRCGHVYCQQCLTHALRREKKCPTCRKALKGNTAYHLLFLNRG